MATLYKYRSAARCYWYALWTILIFNFIGCTNDRDNYSLEGNWFGYDQVDTTYYELYFSNDSLVIINDRTLSPLYYSYDIDIDNLILYRKGNVVEKSKISEVGQAIFVQGLETNLLKIMPLRMDINVFEDREHNVENHYSKFVERSIYSELFYIETGRVGRVIE